MTCAAYEETAAAVRIPGTSGIILAGGNSTRLREDKLSLRLNGRLIIENTLALFRQLFDNTIVSVARGKRVDLAHCDVVHDEYPGSLGGIYSGLRAAPTPVAFVAACDMPFINPAVVHYQASFAHDYDVVIPRTRAGLEPLHAFYSKNCLEPIRVQLQNGRFAIREFFGRVRVKEIGPEEVARFDTDGLCFFNINTAEDLQKAGQIRQCMAMR
jgi:molybdopterin-guanine dinucleotide biosynthesis protein A